MSASLTLEQFLKSNQQLLQNEIIDIEKEEDLTETMQDDEQEPEEVEEKESALPSEVTESEIVQVLELLKTQNLLPANVASVVLAKQPQIHEAYKCYKATNDANDFVETISFFSAGMYFPCV